MIEHDHLTPDQLRAIRATAEREIARLDQELLTRPPPCTPAAPNRAGRRLAQASAGALERVERETTHV